MNSFLALRREDIQHFTEQRKEIVRERVQQQLRTAEFIGDILEMFVPVMADTLAVMGGGEPTVREGDYLTLQEAEDDDPFGGEDDDFDGGPPPGPTDRNEIIR